MTANNLCDNKSNCRCAAFAIRKMSTSKSAAMWVHLGLLLLLAILSQGREYDVPVPAGKPQFFGIGVETRITNGEDAAKNQFPYQTAMYMDDISFCGGAIISPRWVLTAAHCVQWHHLFTVYLGALEMNVPDEPGRVVLDTRTAHVHEDFDRNSMENDVGLVKLPIDIKFNDQINAIPLPPRSFNNRDFAGQRVRVSGWGKVKDGQSMASRSGWVHNRLQFVDLTVISNEKCKETHADAITEKIVCAVGDNGKSPCTGDSGGPLVIIEEPSNKTTHFAVVSFVAMQGCSSGAPSGYDRTYKFLDWINGKTGIPIQN